MYKVYGADGCSFCVKAKNLLEQRGEDFEYIDIGVDLEAREYLKNDLKVRQIPQVFHGDKHLGGFTELASYLQ